MVDNICIVFREALADIFERCDLDGNGFLSREEFDLFQMKSGGEQCDDDAWEIMKGNIILTVYDDEDEDDDDNDDGGGVLFLVNDMLDILAKETLCERFINETPVT